MGCSYGVPSSLLGVLVVARVLLGVLCDCWDFTKWLVGHCERLLGRFCVVVGSCLVGFYGIARWMLVCRGKFLGCLGSC